MSFIKFTNHQKPIQATALRLNTNHVEISGCEINTSGFLCYQDAAMTRLYGDYSNFTTLYQEKDESFILSNDGSVYPVKPEEVKPTLREEVEALKGSVAAISNSVEGLQGDMQAINTAMEV